MQDKIMMWKIKSKFLVGRLVRLPKIRNIFLLNIVLIFKNYIFMLIMYWISIAMGTYIKYNFAT